MPIDAQFEDADALRDEVRDLKRELAQSRAETIAAKRDAGRALAALRKQLGPLYRALQDVFGELDTATSDEAPYASQSGAWDEWKRRLGPSCAKVIDALLLGGEMSVKAIMVSAKMGPNTVYQATSKMGQAGILSKNGGKFSLKVK